MHGAGRDQQERREEEAPGRRLRGEDASRRPAARARARAARTNPANKPPLAHLTRVQTKNNNISRRRQTEHTRPPF